MKVLKTGPITKKLMIFIILSLYYLYIVHAFIVGHGILNGEEWINFSKDKTLLFIFSLFVAVSVFQAKKWSKMALLVLVIWICSESFYSFYQTQNKVVLLGTFFYSIMSFLILLLWREELKSSVFNPNFSKNQLHRKDKYNLPVKITGQKNEYGGVLTNWDKDSCFIHIENKKQAVLALKGWVKVTMNFLGKDFCAMGQVMTKYSDGFGIRFGEKKEASPNWNDFYAIIMDRGLKQDY